MGFPYVTWYSISHWHLRYKLQLMKIFHLPPFGMAMNPLSYPTPYGGLKNPYKEIFYMGLTPLKGGGLKLFGYSPL